MDEPLSNLDAKLRVQTRAELVELQRRLSATIVYVTHDQVEAMTMGHRIAVLDAGVLQQIGPPQEVYARPANLFVARFIGSPPMNTVDGRIAARGRRPRRRASRGPGTADPRSSRTPSKRPVLENVVLGVRPEDLRLGDDGGVTATVAVVESLGHERHVACRLADGQLVIVRQRAQADAPAPEDVVHLIALPEALHVFDPDSGNRIDSRDRSDAVTTAVHDRVVSTRTKWKERGLGYLLLLPALADLRRLRLLSAHPQRLPRLLPQPAVPGPAEHLRRLRPVPRRAHVVGLPRQPEDHRAVRDHDRARWASGSGSRSRCSRTSSSRGIGIYRTIFSSTVATSVAVAAVIFGTLMNPQVGLLPWLGITTQPPILQNPTWALPAVAVTTIWQTLGLTFILMSAGLQSVPDDLLEAARVDGAGAWSRFWHVTLPMLSPTVFFAVVIGSIFAFQTFGQIDLLTQGGPLKKTNVLTYFIYTQHREQPREGGGARGRAVRDHARCSRSCRCGSSNGGSAMTVEAAEIGVGSPAPDLGQGRAATRCSRSSAFIVIFPIYITVVNSLLTPSQITQPAAEVLPHRSAVEQLQRRVGRRAHGRVPEEQLHRHRDHHRRAARHRDPRRLRVRLPRVPVQAHAVRRVPRHVDGAVRGHRSSPTSARSATSAGTTPTRASRCRSSPPASARS